MGSGNHHRTIALAAIALEKILELELSADPQSFELWYAYATGENQKLKDEIDDTLRRHGTLTEHDVSQLHANYVSAASASSARTTTQLNSVASKLTDEVSQVVRMINEAVASVGRYDETLRESAAAVDSAESGQGLSTVVEGLIRATKSIERENCALKEQLETSKSRSEMLKHEIEVVRVESLTDPLTQIGNRQYFDDSLAKAITKANENDVPLTLLLVDVDHFKRVNDQFGHQMGDDVLRLVAARLRSSVRDGEIARYGGEEFGVVLYNKSLAIGRLIAERIRVAVEGAEMRVRSTGAPVGQITVSIGVAELRARVSGEDLVRNADAALYVAKRKGRNCVVLEEVPETDSAENRAAG